MTESARARRAMIDSQLRPQGVTDPLVLAAMAAVPREDFVPAEARAFAYFDRAIEVDGGTMIPPAPLARLLGAAELRAGERALVVSAAPAYAAEVLRSAGVVALELPARDAAEGKVPAGPFDVILLEGAVGDVPTTLSDALAEGGRLVTAMLVSEGVTRLAVGRKVAGTIGYTRFADSEIAPLPGFTRPAVFTF